MSFNFKGVGRGIHTHLLTIFASYVMSEIIRHISSHEVKVYNFSKVLVGMTVLVKKTTLKL